MNEKPPSPPLLCRLIGHRWLKQLTDEKTDPGFRRVTTYNIQFCLRCGVPNPSFEK